MTTSCMSSMTTFPFDRDAAEPFYKQISAFTLAQHPNGNGQYVLTGVRHSASATEGSKLDYQNSFTCIPLTVPYRPPRVTPRPRIGVQTAVVVGPAGEEIYTDKYGRVKVQFHWDRQGKKDENSSCWVRVAALHAGQESGFTMVLIYLTHRPIRPILSV